MYVRSYYCDDSKKGGVEKRIKLKCEMEELKNNIILK